MAPTYIIERAMLALTPTSNTVGGADSAIALSGPHPIWSEERRAGMGLNTNAATMGTGPVIAPAATGILDPSTGRPAGASDPYFLEVNHDKSITSSRTRDSLSRPQTTSSPGLALAP